MIIQGPRVAIRSEAGDSASFDGLDDSRAQRKRECYAGLSCSILWISFKELQERSGRSRPAMTNDIELGLLVPASKRQRGLRTLFHPDEAARYIALHTKKEKH